MLRQIYINENVLDAAKERVSKIFDEFENVCVSISGGKDSTVTAHLVLSEANRRGRQASVFFLDEEVDYAATIDQVKYIMFDMFPDAAAPVWYQFPFHLTNATSLTEGQLIAWEPGKHKVWMRPKDPRSIHAIPWDKSTVTVRNKVKGFGFYDVLENFESHRENTCFCVGLRATESPNRWRAVAKNPGYIDSHGDPWFWCTKLKNNCISAYPIYDFNFSDVWRYIYENGLRYNKMYDYMWKKGMHLQEIRVSSLIHEKSFKALTELPSFEPKTYDKLLARIDGIAVGNIYGKDPVMMKARKLPKNYKSWMEYRDFLLTTYPDKEKLPIFLKRFARQLNNNYVARQQCRQLILNDYENDLPIKNEEDPRIKTLEKWRNLL